MQANTTDQLSKLIEGEVLTSQSFRSIYATDASNYQKLPSAVVLPKHGKDLEHIVNFARIHNLPITMRGGGTSLAGQTVGSGLIVDCSKYMDKVLEINTEQQWARVQPGVVRDQLNEILEAHHLQFAPDPATSSRATIGGMIANNSSGTKSIRYGKTVDHIQAIRLMTIDGRILELLNHDETSIKALQQNESPEFHYYNQVLSLINDNRVEIQNRYPKSNAPGKWISTRRTTGHKQF